MSETTSAPEKNEDVAAGGHFVRLRGLPFSAIDDDIKEFFSGINVIRVKFTINREGRPDGEAYVELNNEAEVEEAKQRDKNDMKGRYIEVFAASQDEGSHAFNSNGYADESGHVVRLRGLPWTAHETDISDFFKGLECAEIVIGGKGSRPTGEAFVKFDTSESAQKAMKFNKSYMGSRYIEVFPSSVVELNREKGLTTPGSQERTGIRPLMSMSFDRRLGASSASNHATGYEAAPKYGYEDQRGGGYDDYYGAAAEDHYGYSATTAEGFRVYMRGLPFDADAYSITSFFSPLQITLIKLGINEIQRPSGDAIVEFVSEPDFYQALSKNRERMGKRYIELFTNDNVPSTMKYLTWNEVTGQNAGGPPAYDSILYYGPPRRGPPPRMGPPRGGPRGGRGGPRGRDYERDNGHWNGYDYDAYQGYDPYDRDRHREARPAHDPYAASWGGWEGY